MRNEYRNPFLWLLLVCSVATYSLSACGSSNDAATPTLALEAISTYAYQTVSAGMTAEATLTPPTEIPPPVTSPTAFATLALPSPLPTISFASPTALTGVSSDCDNSAYIADITIPDNAHLDPGQKFVKTWLVQNTGTCAWSTSYKLSFVDGLEMEGSDAHVPLPVPVGQQVELSVSMRAPTSPGQYYGRWQMQNVDKRPFGSILRVVIKVDPLAATAAP